MTAIDVLLQTLALIALASLALSSATRRALGWIERSDLQPATRADLALAALALPMAAMGLIAVAALLPGALHLMGLRLDHCGAHGHHAHLCLAHPTAAAAPLVAPGALALAGFGARAIAWFSERARASLNLAKLRLGASPWPGAPDILRVPCALALCHTTGALRGRVLLSESVERALTPHQLQAALEHERAHIRRRDVLAADLLALLALATTPATGRKAAQVWSAAAEEAADAEAAARVGALELAEALLAVSRLRARPLAASMGSVGTALKQRVERLVEGPAAPRPARAFTFLALMAALELLLAALTAEPLHHVAETLLNGPHLH